MWGVAGGVFSATVLVLKAGKGSCISMLTNRGVAPLFWMSGMLDSDSGLWVSSSGRFFFSGCFGCCWGQSEGHSRRRRLR
jgi:hypothetical protein